MIMNKQWYLYVVECSDGTLYTGITTDIQRRLHEHNHTSKGAKYTKNRRPVQLRLSEEFDSRSSATKAEITFKRLSRKEKLKRIHL
jgi:putative endonuclease